MDETQSAERSGQSPVTSGSGSDWEARVADTIESTVAAVHDRVIRPLVLAARGIVFGIIVGSMALVLCVLLTVALVRLIDAYAFGHRAWAAEALVGAVMAALGIVAWSLRRPRHGTEGQ